MSIQTLVKDRALKVFQNLSPNRYHVIHSYPRTNLFQKLIYAELCKLCDVRPRTRPENETASVSASEPSTVTDWDSLGWGKETSKHRRETPSKSVYIGPRMVGRPNPAKTSQFHQYRGLCTPSFG